MSDNKFKVGLIRVLTSDDPEFVSLHGKIIMEHYPQLDVESRCIPDQWEGIHTKELFAQAVPKIVDLAKKYYADKDMIIVSCADDPGVEELRKAFPGKPVTGGGETTAAIACGYSERVGVLGITDYVPRAYPRICADHLVGNVRPESVHSTLDLMTEQGHKDCLAGAMKLKDMGAGVIACGCTGLGTIGIAQEIEEYTGLPVIDPVLAEGLYAYFESIRHTRKENA
jgi:allantoin racemase